MRWPPWKITQEDTDDEYERQHNEKPENHIEYDKERKRQTADAFTRLEEVTNRLETISQRLENRLEGTPPVPPAKPVEQKLKEVDESETN